MKSLITDKITCGGCDLTRPNADSPSGGMWCHGAPATAVIEITVDVPRPGEPPVQRKNITGYYRPVAKDSIGCALHPAVRGKVYGGGR